MKTIEAGQKLTCRSMCDYGTVYEIEVLKRSKSFATVKYDSDAYRVKIHSDDSGEYVMALGQHSMAPVFRAK